MAETKELHNKQLSINWKPDRSSNVPLYSQIVGYFTNRISHGDWISGQSLPSQRDLSKSFGVNRSTIVAAMEELMAMGLVESSFGGGTRVAMDSWSLLIQEKAPNWQDYIMSGAFRHNIPTVQVINHLEFQEGTIRLSTGEMSPDLVQTELVKKVMNSLSQKELFMNYPDPLGMPSLRRSVQKLLAKRGINVPLSCILIVSGAVQALQLIASGIVRSTSTVYMEAPSYLCSMNIFQSAGAVLSGVPMDKDGIMPWMIRNQQRTGPGILYTIPTFQNPTGIVMPESRRKEVLKYCIEHNMPIIEDDVFCDLWLDNPPPPPLKALDNSGSVVYIGSTSKSFSPGLRLGWLVGPESLVERLADIKMQVDYGVSVLPQQVVTELMEQGLYDQGTETVRKALRHRRDFMLKLLEKYFFDIATWEKPTGGFFIWIKLKNQVLAERVFNKALKERLLVPPGTIYGSKSVSCLRLTFGYLDADIMEKSMYQLSQVIRSF